ncbi:MAG: type II toxin-antitoxin system VapC family toxin [Acidobacteriia bacterium]|nr:type II toxin-antitoxin system VapC family toxin [Terriglobia bacterium]
MILVDANLLIYAVNQDAPLNRKAKPWLESVLSGKESVGFSWSVLLAFLRLTTRPGLFRRPLPADTAFELVGSWLDQTPTTIVHPGPRHLSVLQELLQPVGTGGNLTSDAHLAALAIEHGAELCSSDTDFARFAGLQWRNPLS